MATTPEKYLKSHLDLVEKTLLCRSSVAASAGHPVHKGTLRENFLREFIDGHIGEDLGVSSGEIFDSERVIGGPANQIDIVIYDKAFPKVRIVSEDINAFMCESVHAAIEVKSTLGKEELKAAYTVAHAIRSLDNDMARLRNRHIWCFLIAYQSNASMGTVAEWLRIAAREEECNTVANALDGVFILGKGFVGSLTVAYYMKDRKEGLQDTIALERDWIWVKQESGNLYAIFFCTEFPALWYRYSALLPW